MRLPYGLGNKSIERYVSVGIEFIGMKPADLLPLVLAYVDDEEEIEGVTRFQKLVFLAQQETSLDDGFDFNAHDYGPFSKDLYAALDAYREKGLLRRKKTTTRSGNEKHIYELTDEGRETVSKLLSENEQLSEHSESAENIKKKYNDIPLRELLQYVYHEYEDMASQTKLDI